MSERIITDADKELARQILAKNPFSVLLNIELVELEHGAATCRIQSEEKHQRFGGFLHGGVTASLIDTAAAFAVATLLEQGENSVTVDLTIHYLRPIYAQATATARVLRAGKRLLTVSVETFDEHHQLAATALTTYSRVKLKS